jgi:hypothetical protein
MLRALLRDPLARGPDAAVVQSLSQPRVAEAQRERLATPDGAATEHEWSMSAAGGYGAYDGSLNAPPRAERGGGSC